MKIECEHCNKEYDIPVDLTFEELVDIELGKRSVSEFEELNAWEREMLISNTCDKCWRKFYGS